MAMYNTQTQTLPPLYSATTDQLRTAIAPVKDFVQTGVDRLGHRLGTLAPTTALELSARSNADSMNVLIGLGGNRDLFGAPNQLAANIGFDR